MTSDQYSPERGDLVWLDFDPQAGHEQAGRRPALIISPSEYNKRVGMAIACPVTNREKGYPFEVKLPPGCGATGVVLVDQLKNLDWRSRRAERMGAVSPETIQETLSKIGTLIG